VDENEGQTVVDEPTSDEGVTGTDVQDVGDATAEPTSELQGEPTESPTLSDGVARRVKDYGFGPDDFPGLDDAAVSGVLGAFDRRLATMQPQAQPGAQPEPAPQQQAPTGLEFKPLAIEFGEDVDEGLSKSIGGLLEGVNGRLKEAHEFQQKVANEFQGYAQLRHFEALDRFIASKGEEFVDVYGTGATAEMDPQSAAFVKRIELYTGGNAIAAAQAGIGRPMRQTDAWERGHHAVNHERLAATERKNQDGRRKKRQAQFGEPPSKGKTPVAGNREAAIAAYGQQ
jgi:hypothetical protein